MNQVRDDEHDTDRLEAVLQRDLQLLLAINRLESLGTLAAGHIRRHELASALDKLTRTGQSVQLCKHSLGVK